MVKTIVKEIAKDLYILRLDDDDIRYFEALWYIPEGITYNSYLYLGREARILFDTWKLGYESLFMDTLKEIVDPRNIDYVVIHHMEPDHSGALASLIKTNPQIKVLGHPLVKGMIKSFYNIENIAFRPVKDLEEIEIDDVRIKFIHTPWLHWPETIMSYLYNAKTLFTGDVFGSFSIPSSLFIENPSREYLDFMRKYFVDVIGYYRQHVEKNLNKILNLGLDIQLIAPLHGALWRDIRRVYEYYVKWSRGESVGNKIVIIYGSMYGFTEKAITLIAKLLESKGVNMVIYKITDRVRNEIGDILSDVIDSSAIILGAPTYESGIFPYMEFIVNLLVKKANSPKPVIIVSSYGWGGVAGKLIKNILMKSSFNVIDVIEYKGFLDDNTKTRIENTVNELLKLLNTN